MGEKTATHEKVSFILTSVFELFGEGRFDEASPLLAEALSLDFDRQEVVSALKYSSFWVERERKIDALKDDSEKGEFLLEQWKIFSSFLENHQEIYEDALFAVKVYVFKRALTCFNNLMHQSGAHDPDILFRIGRCYKGLEDYEKALNFFEAASRQRMEDPEILAELGDCYAFLNETKAAKAFFREAFYINPQRIDINSLESMLICRLIERLKGQGFVSPDLAEWIPVYGVLYGVFTVKREMKPLEYGKLKQAIYALECELKEGKDERFLIPRLLNKYFWLVDHIMSAKSERDKLKDTLNKIKKIDVGIYEMYTK